MFNNIWTPRDKQNILRMLKQFCEVFQTHDHQNWKLNQCKSKIIQPYQDLLHSQSQ
jgi:hypothetical protein